MTFLWSTPYPWLKLFAASSLYWPTWMADSFLLKHTLGKLSSLVSRRQLLEFVILVWLLFWSLTLSILWCFKTCRLIQGNKWWRDANVPEAIHEREAVHSFHCGIPWFSEPWAGCSTGSCFATKIVNPADRHGAGWVWGDHTTWCQHWRWDEEEAACPGWGIWRRWRYARWRTEGAVCPAVMILHLVGETRNIGAHLELGSVLEVEIGK